MKTLINYSSTFILSFLLIPQISLGQTTYTLSGTVTDKTGKPMFANISSAPGYLRRRFTDRTTGYYSATVPAGVTLTLTCYCDNADGWFGVPAPGYSNTITMNSNTTVNFICGGSVTPSPTPVLVGITINHGALYTNTPSVSLDLTYPDYTQTVTASNDGGFLESQTFPAASQIPWTLASSGPERLPKTVYVRFDGSSINYTDDIILDEIPPDIRNAQGLPNNGNGKVYVCHNGQTIEIALSALKVHLNQGDSIGVCSDSKNINSAKAGSAKSKFKSISVKITAKDKISGIDSVQFEQGVILTPWLHFKKNISVVANPSRKLAFRLKDKAGNISKLHKVVLH